VVVLSVVSILLYSVMLYYGLVLSFGKLSFVGWLSDKSTVVYKQKHMCGGEEKKCVAVREVFFSGAIKV